jgi:hypothetical protein
MRYTITGAAVIAARIQLAALSDQYRPACARSSSPAGQHTFSERSRGVMAAIGHLRVRPVLGRRGSQ